MRVRKHVHSADPEPLPEQITAYARLARAYRASHVEHAASVWSKAAPLAAAVPLVAAILSPGARAQCVNATDVVYGPVDQGANQFDYYFDFDNDFDYDFFFRRLAVSPPQLRMVVSGNTNAVVADFARNSNGRNYYYVRLFSAGQAITSGAAWKDVDDLPDTVNLANFATMDRGNAGPWNGAGSVAGYVGIRVDGNRLGFIEVTWDNTGTGGITFGQIGLEPASNPTSSINAGNCASLPVELVSFEAVTGPDGVSLQWETASETNNAGFEVQRGTDGLQFYKIGWVEGQGNAAQSIDYRFTDADVVPGTTYHYRLKQVDYDGTFAYSPVTKLEVAPVGRTRLRSIAPNPATSGDVVLYVDAPAAKPATVAVYNTLGQLVRRQQVDLDREANTLRLDLDGVGNGQYFVKIEAGDEVLYKPVLLTR